MSRPFFCSLHREADDFLSKAALNDDIRGTVNPYCQPTNAKRHAGQGFSPRQSSTIWIPVMPSIDSSLVNHVNDFQPTMTPNTAQSATNTPEASSPTLTPAANPFLSSSSGPAISTGDGGGRASRQVDQAPSSGAQQGRPASHGPITDEFHRTVVAMSHYFTAHPVKPSPEDNPQDGGLFLPSRPLNPPPPAGQYPIYPVPIPQG